MLLPGCGGFKPFVDAASVARCGNGAVQQLNGCRFVAIDQLLPELLNVRVVGANRVGQPPDVVQRLLRIPMPLMREVHGIVKVNGIDDVQIVQRTKARQ